MGKTLTMTHPDKRLWPRVSKQDLLSYYVLVWPRLRPFLQGRPLTIKRCPSGNLSQCFIQKDVDDAPSAVRILDVLAQTTGEVIQIPLIENETALRWLAQIAAVELHGWLSRVSRTEKRFASKSGLLTSLLNRPDILVFDIDPPKSTGTVLQNFKKAAEGAERVMDFCAKSGIRPFIKTSGKFGVHLFIPIRPERPFPEAREAFKQVCERISAQFPDVFTLVESKAKRGTRILLDYAQNSIGKTTVLPWSPRATEEATISLPIARKDLQHIDPRDFTIPWALKALAKRPDPWQGFFRKPYQWKQVERLIPQVPPLRKGR